MSFKQVTELRKSGQLREAYEMALNDYNSNPDDVWAAKAMFWAIHDMAHAELQQGYVDEAALMANRMKDLLPRLEEPESEDKRSLPDRALARLVRHLQPFYQDVKAAYHEAQSGDTFRPYNYIVQLLDNGQLSEPLHERAGWIIWNHLWKQQQYLPGIEARQALARYMRLTGVLRPSPLHSHILAVALRLSKRLADEFDLPAFIDVWDEDNLMPTDWERLARNKGQFVTTSPSLAEKAVMGYINYKKQAHDLTYSDKFMTLLETAVERYPDKDEYKRYLSLAHFNRGDKERSLELHRQLAITHGRYYVWHELANMLTHDLDLKTSALCQTLTIQAPENFVCDVHRELGWELSREGNMAAALHELELYKAIRERCGWPRSWRYEQLRKRIPTDTVATADNDALYAQRAIPIIDWVYKDIPQEPAIVVARFRDKQNKEQIRLALPGGRAVFVRANKLPRDGRYLYIRTIEDKGKLKLLTAAVAERNDIVPRFADSVTGDVRIIQGQGGKQFGFVEGCFVPGQLLQGVSNGETLTILTETQPDGRRRATAVI